MKILRPTYAEINLKNIVYNVNILKNFLDKSTDILAVIKADAYGHGAIKVAKTLENTSVKMFGVATIEEGIELRDAGIKKDVLILGSTFPLQNFKEIINYNLKPTIASISGLVTLNKYAAHANKKVPFHLKIDTGMGRIGIKPHTVDFLQRRIKNLKNVSMEGIYSHIACACEDNYFTKQQIYDFKNLTSIINTKYSHISASASILKYINSHFNLVRPGLLLYGLLPFDYSDKILLTKPALTLKSKIVFLKTVSKNTPISYGRTFITKRQSKIATIPIGYADGFFRYNSNNAEVIINNTRAPIIGRVCMDMTMVDVTKIKNVSVGNEVVIIGSQGKEKISAEEVASRCGTINYEVVTSISKRVPRLYI